MASEKTIETAGDATRHGLATSMDMLLRLIKPSGRGVATTDITHSSQSSSLVKRQMRSGAVAGTVVGVVVAVGLLLLCLYPFFRRCYRNAYRAPFDVEAAMAAEAGVAMGPHRRLSSSDSFRQNGDLSRGDLGGRGSKELDWGPPHDGNGFAYTRGADGQLPSSSSFAGGDAAFSQHAVPGEYRVRAAPFPLLNCYDGEFAPRISEDDQPGVLKGTSADYYSPFIPSSAFGMITEPEPSLDVPTPISTSSHHGSFLRFHMKQMFRRKSDRDQTLSSTTTTSPACAEGPSPDPAGAARSMPPSITTDDRVESPISFSMPPPPTSQNYHAPISPPEVGVKTSPEPPFPPYQPFKKSPPPAVYAAPGTVNPMDIMPASTESEVWHRTEHQLFVSSYEPPPSNTATLPQPGPIMPSPSPTPPETQSQPTFTAPSPVAATSIDFAPKQEPTESHHHGAMPGPTCQRNGNLATTTTTTAAAAAATAASDNRQSAHSSDHPTPLPSHALTDISSQTTPSTQLDSPSPESIGSSDFRHSASPQSGLGNSPKTGVFRCDEPGCTQVFDQPHKLKHHQRYHSKDHKCTYPGCGKGFGTKTHLQRHINDRHEKKKKFHCSVPGCDYSRAGGKAFPRKDNWKRHMTKIHNIDQQQLPEPVEVDMEMGGT